MKGIKTFFSSGIVGYLEHFTELKYSIFNRSRETVLVMPFGDEKVTQFSGFPPTSASYLKPINEFKCSEKIACLAEAG